MNLSPSLLRRVYALMGVLFCSTSLLPAADKAENAESEPKEIVPWLAGGKLHGFNVRRDEGPQENSVAFMSSRMWGFYGKKGLLTLIRPGKDAPPKGEEVFWLDDSTLLGKAGARRVWQVKMKEEREDDAKGKETPAVMVMLGQRDAEEENPTFVSLVFFLVGNKGDTLSCKFDEGGGRLVVTQQPAGKGDAHSYEFQFKGEVPSLVEPAKKTRKR